MPSDSHSVVLSVSGFVLSLGCSNRSLVTKDICRREGNIATAGSKDDRNNYQHVTKSSGNVVVYYFNRNPLIFMHIVDFYRTGMLHFPHHYCWSAISDELEYWRIDRSFLADCCQKLCSDHKRRVEGFREMQHIFGDDVRRFQSAVINTENIDRFSQIRNVIAQFYNNTTATKTIRVKCYLLFYISVVILYLMSYVMQSESNFREVRPEDEVCVDYKLWINTTLASSTVWQSKTNTTPSAGKMAPKYVKYFISSPLLTFKVIDGVCNTIFYADLFLRFMGSASARTFFADSGHIMDCLCNICDITAFGLHVSHGPNFSCNIGVLVIYLLLEVSRVIRVMRLIQFTNRYNGIIVLILTLRASMRELLLLLSVLGAGVVVFGFLIYVAELSDSQVSRFDSFMMGFWYSMVTMTTLGYGEITPTTPAGYLIGSACAITGVIFVALQVPVIANKFNALYTYACDQQLREQWMKEQAIVSGEITGNMTTERQQQSIDNTKKANGNFKYPNSSNNPVLEFKRQLQCIPTYYTPASLTPFCKTVE